MEIRRISSARNDRVRHWRKLGTRKGRDEYGSLLIEGITLLEEAVRAGWSVRALIVPEEGLEVLKRLPTLEGVPVYSLLDSTFNQVVETQAPQGIAAEVGMALERGPFQPDADTKVLLLDAIQDPGNLGAILRTAEAAGVRDIWLGSGTVDPYNPKVVRSAMGSLFRSRIRRVDLKKAIPELKELGYTVVGTSPRGKDVHFDFRYPERVAVLLGNEGKGISSAIGALADTNVRIPMPGIVESLNVSVTAGILLYEIVRQSGDSR
ncbi:RNA methyltransferase, TrmH family [Marininema mesophilum]|uniref:RNA methyltransferase, TrmH family n=1 Tax=Marininema mesophilum TaxID=1048340 RepID=A0A1H3CMQ4_9BACL|nr:RNA methyltransferase [Marininema mesophilum]SDX55407.1 RNA methyltransferase, TrmH family [Marininema mesophilum]